MKLASSLIIILGTSIMITFSANIAAQGNSSATNKTNQQSSTQQVVKSANQAAKMAKGRYGGKVLKVQTKKSGYRVKLIKSDGNIISVFVNAKSGKISGQ